MRVQQIWRYPVKSMAGARLEQARVSLAGIEGDRVVHVRNARGGVVTSRTHPALLGHKATLDASGEPLIDGRKWTDAEVLGDIRKIAGPGATLVRDESLDRFDVLPLLVATDGAIAAFGRDGRRLRPNLVISGVEGLEERKWSGSTLRIGAVRIAVVDPRGRCVMTTFDPGTLGQDPEVLRDIVRRFGGKLALHCQVEQEGVIQIGQAVELLPASKAPHATQRRETSAALSSGGLATVCVGESPPASGRFFYQGDSGLYRAMRDAFLTIDPSITDDSFLGVFQTSGCYMIDLCPHPVDQLDGSRAVRRAGPVRLCLAALSRGCNLNRW